MVFILLKRLLDKKDVSVTNSFFCFLFHRHSVHPFLIDDTLLLCQQLLSVPTESTVLDGAKTKAIRNFSYT